MNLSRKLSSALALFATTVAVATPASAADSGHKAVKVVEFLNNGVPSQLLVQLTDDTLYYANVGQSPCATVKAPSVDTVKTWASFAQSALLSGKNVKIYYEVCGGARYITIVDLRND